MKKFKDIRPEWNDERMDIIGQNGNDGLHYEEVAEAKVPFDPPYNKIKDRRNSDKTKTSGFSIAKQLAKSAMKTAKKEDKQLDELDQATIGSYLKKAHNQIGDLNRKAYKKDPDHGDSKNLSKPDQKKLKKRAAGTDRAWTNYVSQHKGHGRMRNSRGMGRDHEGRTGSLVKKNESVEYDLNEELMFKVKIEGLPAMIMTGKSPADIKASLRKILKKQDSIKDIPVERLSKAEVKKRYRDLAGEKINEANDEDKQPASPDEKSMALKQCEFIEYVGRELCEYIGKNKEFPEWMQNKLSGLHEKAKDMHATLGDHGNDDKEETNESNVYFGTYNKHGDRDKPAGKSRSQMFRDARKKADERIAKRKASGKINPLKPGSKMKVYDADGNLIGHKTVGPKEEVDKEKRLDTIRKAQMKAQEKRRKAEKRAQKAAMADMDEASCGSKRKVNELSKNTLGSYIGKATDDKQMWKGVKKAFKKKYGRTEWEDSKIAKRNTGIKKAATKLVKKL